MNLQPVLIRIPFQGDLSIPQRVQRQREFARKALDHCASLMGAPTGHWPATSDGVPLPREGFYWSIAHKPRFAAAVVADQPVGIDIEALIPRQRDLSPAVATQDEWRLAGSGLPGRESKRGVKDPSNFELRTSADWRIFFAVWTAKEAVLKANSTGISGLNICKMTGLDPLGRMTLSYQEHHLAVEHFLYANHLAAVTCSGTSILWHVI